MTTSSPTTRILAGSGRSGTTWLLDVLCKANDLRPVFEPLHPAAWADAVPFAHKYAGAGDGWPALERLWCAIEAHEYSAVWSDYRTRPDRLRPHLSSVASWSAFKRFAGHWLSLKNNHEIYAPQRTFASSLIKVIRANLMVPWLAARAHTRVAFVIRHPAAVVESQLRLGFDWNARIIAGHYADDQRLNRRLGVDWSALYGCTNSDAELFTMIWCLENLLPLQDCKNTGNVNFVFYEDLVTQDASAWQALLQGLALEYMPDAQLLRKPSQQASGDLGRTSFKKSQLTSSLERLTTVDRDSIQRVLDQFGVTIYNTASIMPDKSGMEYICPQNWSHLYRRSA